MEHDRERSREEERQSQRDRERSRDREYDEPELTQTELKALRSIIESDKRVKWLWSTLRLWALWITAVVAGVTIGWETLGKIVKALIGR